MTDRPEGGIVERRSGDRAVMAVPVKPTVSTGTHALGRGVSS
jgi:hypothetical protein